MNSVIPSILALLLLPGVVVSQSFVPVNNPVDGTNPLPGAKFGAIAFADVNQDQIPDILITGDDYANVPFMRLFLGNGTTFTEDFSNEFTGISRSSVAFADIDLDGDQDLMTLGEDFDGILATRLYLNNGKGKFVEQNGTSFPRLSFGSICFVHLDSDAYPDLILTGRNPDIDPETMIYRNQGNGTFQEVANPAIESLAGGSISCADIDNDNDLDFVLTGDNEYGSARTEVYLNNGSALFTRKESNGLPRLFFGSSDLADTDGDGDVDLILTGMTSDYKQTTALFLNDGSGSFTMDNRFNFVGVASSAVSFVDFDNDGDPDLVISGASASGPQAAFLTNVIDGQFGILQDVAPPGLLGSQIAVTDFDNDGDNDVLMTGMDGNKDNRALLYQNQLVTTSVMPNEHPTENTLEQPLLLYPNPVLRPLSAINVEVSSTGFSEISIIDLAGKVLKSEQRLVEPGTTTIPIGIDGLDAGTYLVRIRLQNGISTGTFSIVK